MFLTHLLIGYFTLTLFGQDSGLSPNVALAGATGEIEYVVHQEKKSWDDANTACLNDGHTAAYIISYKEHQNLIKHIKSHNLLPADEKSGYWLGGKNVNGKFEWEIPGEDTRNEDNFMAGWHKGEPNEREKNGVKQACMELKYVNDNPKTQSLAWNDMWCDEKRGYICQHVI